MSSQAPGWSDATPSWIDRGRIPSLDGLRAIAIGLVLFCHWHFPLCEHPAVHAVHWRAGVFGVQLFFVLSGFLITTLMLREVQRTGGLSVRHFYLRRILRIVPVYVVYLAVLIALQAAGLLYMSGRHWLALGTYTVNFLGAPLSVHVWSLSVEEHFYLLWPLVMAGLTLTGARRTALLVMAGALALRWILLLTLSRPDWPVERWTFTRIDDIACGCLLAFLARNPVWCRRLSDFVRRDGLLGVVLLAFLGGSVLCSPLFNLRLFGPTASKLLVGLANDVASVTIAMFLWAAVTRPDSLGGKILNHRVAVVIGVLSYSLYLWHPLFFLEESPLACGFPFNFALSFLVAGLSYGLVERPFLSLKDRLAAPAPLPGKPSRRPALVLPGIDATSSRALSMAGEERS
jgi:peptidoglycan/LPS O-acetylase OafA/YrhL